MVAGTAVERLAEQVRRVAREQGALVSLIHAVARETPVPEFAALEIACTTALSRFAAENEVRLAAELSERLPDVLAMICAGDLGLRHGQVFADVLSCLDTEIARRVAALVLPRSAGKTCGQLRDMLRRRALAADPSFVTARRQRAEAQRSVQLHASDDGTASLVAFGLEATRATAAMQRVAAIARARRLAGSTDKLEQLRADVFLELLEGKHQDSARGVVQLEVNLETLARFDDQPGSLGSYGPVAADIARQFAEARPGFQWQYAIRSRDGTLLQQGLTRARPTVRNGPSDDGGRHDSEDRKDSSAEDLVRAPQQSARERFANAAMTRWIRLRDRTCRAPGCRRPAAGCQLDHSIRFADGGPTVHGNLGALCEYHHRAKGEGGWTVIQRKPGYFRWISPMGRIYEVGPEPP